eukprot:TRINITY_DN1821_c0_g1_i2.p1 TRINITY_DN1821_c0_g1~~TRINITY_DN1821_c0_g1_i2.p1  ORF type:complete len:745 (-),score=187.61 TRINITY_DN1821_c0_g1_i2:234-2153(-)
MVLGGAREVEDWVDKDSDAAAAAALGVPRAAYDTLLDTMARIAKPPASPHRTDRRQLRRTGFPPRLAMTGIIPTFDMTGVPLRAMTGIPDFAMTGIPFEAQDTFGTPVATHSQLVSELGATVWYGLCRYMEERINKVLAPPPPSPPAAAAPVRLRLVHLGGEVPTQDSTFNDPTTFFRFRREALNDAAAAAFLHCHVPPSNGPAPRRIDLHPSMGASAPVGPPPTSSTCAHLQELFSGPANTPPFTAFYQLLESESDGRNPPVVHGHALGQRTYHQHTLRSGRRHHALPFFGNADLHSLMRGSTLPLLRAAFESGACGDGAGEAAALSAPHRVLHAAHFALDAPASTQLVVCYPPTANGPPDWYRKLSPSVHSFSLPARSFAALVRRALRPLASGEEAEARAVAEGGCAGKHKVRGESKGEGRGDGDGSLLGALSPELFRYLSAFLSHRDLVALSCTSPVMQRMAASLMSVHSSRLEESLDVSLVDHGEGTAADDHQVLKGAPDWLRMVRGDARGEEGEEEEAVSVLSRLTARLSFCEAPSLVRGRVWFRHHSDVEQLVRFLRSRSCPSRLCTPSAITTRPFDPETLSSLEGWSALLLPLCDHTPLRVLNTSSSGWAYVARLDSLACGWVPSSCFRVLA